MKRSVSLSIKSALSHLDESPDLRELLRAGQPRRVVNLGLGESPFPPPPAAAELLRRNADACRYSPSDGCPELRAAFADFHGWPGGAESVVIGPGCRGLLFALLLAFEGRIFIAAPAWSACGPQCELLRRLHSAVFVVPTDFDDAWKIKPSALRRAVLSVESGCRGSETASNKLLVLASPGNPSGQCYSAEEFARLAETLAELGFTAAVSDETYALLRYDGRPHRSLSEFYPDGAVILTSLSKWAGLAGWRIGCALFPRRLVGLQESVAGALSQMAPCAPTPQQLAAAELLRAACPDPGAATTAACRVLRRLGRFCSERLSGCGRVRVLAPQAGFFLLIDLTDLADDLRCLGADTAGQVCTRLLRDLGLLLLPGDAFMLPPEAVVLRLCFLDFDGGAAVEAANQGGDKEVEDNDERFVLSHCQPTADAVLRLCDWLRRLPERAAAERDWQAELRRVGRELATSALLGALELCC